MASPFAVSVVDPAELRDASLETAGSGGIHYRSANEDGLRAGLGIGVLTFTQTMQPRRDRRRD